MASGKPNRQKSVDVSREGEQYPPTHAATSATDLDDDEVWLLCTHALRNHQAGQEPADYCKSVFGFTPTDADRALIAKVVFRLCTNADRGSHTWVCDRLRAAWIERGWWSPAADAELPEGKPSPWWPDLEPEIPEDTAAGNWLAPLESGLGPARSGEMAPTASYHTRRWEWEPADVAADRWDGRDGTLWIAVEHGRKVEEDGYKVEEMDPLPGLTGRVFRLTNLTDPDVKEPYRVVVGALQECTCMAGACRKNATCKHLDAMRAICGMESYQSAQPRFEFA